MGIYMGGLIVGAILQYIVSVYWGEPERAPHSRDSCGHRRGRDRDRDHGRVALSVHITSPHVLRTWSWHGLTWVQAPQSGLAWGRVVHTEYGSAKTETQSRRKR